MKTCLITISCIFTFGFSHKAQAQIAICAGATTALTGATTGGTWSSSNTVVATVGLSTGIVTGVSAGTASIIYSGSSGTSVTSVTVNPVPMLSSTLTPTPICDSNVFNYTPMSATAGTIFSWFQPYIPGIYSASASGSGNPDVQLINTTYVQVPVVFTYTLSANGCTNTQNVTVTVYPTPMLSSTLTPPAICDTFIYLPTSYTLGAMYAWNRPESAGIIPETNYGVDSVFEVLHNSTTDPVVVSYLFRLTIGDCPNLYFQTVTVTVEPCPLSTANEISNSRGAMKVFPNPTNGFFTMEMPNSANRTIITISDILGKVIETRNVETGTHIKEVFNLDNLPIGTYFIKAVADGQIYRNKVVIR